MCRSPNFAAVGTVTLLVILLVIPSVVLFGLLTPEAEAAQLELVAIADTWTHGLTSLSTAGGTDTRVSICPRAGYWMYFKFDLDAVPGPIRDVELRLTRFSGSRPNEISAYLITDDSWTEDEFSGANRPEPRSPDPSTTLAMGEQCPTHDRWASAALTSAVVAEAEGDGLLTLMVREDPSNNLDVRHYFSREGPDAEEHPRLVLTVGEPDGETAGVSWRAADIGVGVKPALDIGPDGRLHVMGMTEENPDGVVWYATADTALGLWSSNTVATGYFYGPGDIALADDGIVHMALHDHISEDARHITVASDGTLGGVLNPSPRHNGWDNALAFDSAGNLHMSSNNPRAFGSLHGLEYNFFDGATWDYQSLEGSDAFCYGLATDIAVGRDDVPHMVYCSALGFDQPGDLTYVVREDTTWIYEDVVTGGVVGRFPSLALDHWEIPHIAWLDLDPGATSGTVRYGLRNNDAWEIETVDTLDHVKVGFSDARKSVSLVLDANSRPHVAYADQRTIRYATKPFGDWIYETVVEHVEDTYKGMVVMDLGPGDSPTLVFWQEATLPDPGLVRVATRFSCAELGILCARFARGDCNGDGVGIGDLADALALLFHNFDGTPALGCLAACDGNGDGDTSGVADAVYFLMHEFLNGSAPVAPYPECGLSAFESDVTLGCAQEPDSC